MNQELDDWAFMWRESMDNYALLKVDPAGPSSIDNCLIFDLLEYSSLIIEDDELATQIVSNLKMAGVPIVDRSSLPPEENTPGKLVEEMVIAGKSPTEINAALREIGLQQRSRASSAQKQK